MRLIYRIVAVLLVLSLYSGFGAQAQGLPKKERQEKFRKNEWKKGDTASNYIIEYDFHTKKYTRNQVLPRVHHPVMFRIKNINRFAYDAIITSKDSVLAVSDITDAPKSEKVKPDTVRLDTARASKAVITPNSAHPNTAFRVSGTSASASANAIVEQLKLAQELAALKSKMHADARRIDATLEKITISRSSLQVNRNQRNSVAQTVANPSNDSVAGASRLALSQIQMIIAQDSVELAKLENAIQIESQQMQSDSNRFRQISFSINQIDHYAQKLASVRIAFDDLIRTYRAASDVFRKHNQLIGIASLPLLSQTDFEKACKDSSLELNDAILFNYRQSINQFDNNLQDFYTQYELVVRDYEITQVLSETGVLDMQRPVEALKEIVDKLRDFFAREQPLNALNQMVLMFKTMLRPDAYEVVSAPIQPSQDLVVFDVQIRRKAKQEFNNERSFQYREFLRGGLRYDFSTGLVINFGVDNHSYRTEPIAGNDTTVTVRENTKTNLFAPSVAAMLHASIRQWRHAAIGFTLGVSLNTADLNINSIFPGLSLMVGKSEKIIFTAGPALKRVNYLDSRFNVDKPYPASQFAQGAVPTTSVFRVGGFIGVSYNLTQKQRSSFSLFSEKNQ